MIEGMGAIERPGEANGPVGAAAAPLVGRALWPGLMRLRGTYDARLIQAETRLAAAEAVIAAIPDPLLLIDARRRIVRANEAAAALIGRRAEPGDLAGALRNPGAAVRRRLAAARRAVAEPGHAGTQHRVQPVGNDGSGPARPPRPDRRAGARRRGRAADPRRHHRPEADRADAGGLHRQCRARAEDAAGGADRLYRDAARAGPRRRRRARAVSRDHARAGQANGPAGR